MNRYRFAALWFWAYGIAMGLLTYVKWYPEFLIMVLIGWGVGTWFVTLDAKKLGISIFPSVLAVAPMDNGRTTFIPIAGKEKFFAIAPLLGALAAFAGYGAYFETKTIAFAGVGLFAAIAVFYLRVRWAKEVRGGSS